MRPFGVDVSRLLCGKRKGDLLVTATIPVPKQGALVTVPNWARRVHSYDELLPALEESVGIAKAAYKSGPPPHQWAPKISPELAEASGFKSFRELYLCTATCSVWWARGTAEATLLIPSDDGKGHAMRTKVKRSGTARQAEDLIPLIRGVLDSRRAKTLVL